MSEEIHYIDRLTKKEEKEKVYGQIFIQMLYGKNLFARILSFFLLPLVARISFLSHLYGAFQKSRFSKYKIRPFIEVFKIDTEEFLDPISSFSSFNDFFIRKLKPECRPIANGQDIAVLPADARYLVYPNLLQTAGIWVKGEKFSVEELLGKETLAHKYEKGSCVLARLCPTDYHRFHFPVSGMAGVPKLIRGSLFSVNPLALKRNIHILTENKRMVTEIQTKNFGTILYIEVGATHVGSIHQTFTPNEPYAKGDEKGYFSFGGSCIILLFEPFRIQFDQDLVDASRRGIEVRGLLGQSLGHALTPL